MLLARYIAEFSILYPAALLCYLPLSGFLRLRVKALCPLVLSVVTAFVLLGSAVCMRFQLKTNALLLPMMRLVLQPRTPQPVWLVLLMQRGC